MPDTVIIANPASGRGRGARMLPAVRDAFATTGVTDVRVTTRSGDESMLVHSALADGARTIVVLGGDGTWGRCAGAVLDANGGSRVRLAFLSAGTGNDFAKNLGAPDHDPGAMARLVADHARERIVDAGAVDSGGKTHWFLNVVGFGFDAQVLEDTTRGGALSGNAVYIMAALRQLFRYEGVAYTIGGVNGVTTLGMMLVISNGRSFGGAFTVAPAARVDDGVLNMVQFGDVFGWKRIPLFLSALRGTHLSHPHVRERRGHLFELAFHGAQKCDLDGELVQLASRDAIVRCVKGALRVVA